MSSIFKDREEAWKYIASNWYKVVKERENTNESNHCASSDDAFRFMTYWIAFNSLYSELFNTKSVKLSDLWKEYSYSTKQSYITETNKIAQDDENIIDILKFKHDKWFNRVHSNTSDNVYVKEQIQIFLYTNIVIPKLMNCVDDFQYYIEGCNELAKQPISSGSSGKSHDKFLSIYKDKDLNSKDFRNLFFYRRIFYDKNAPFNVKMISLIMTIYQIRCNLFHGEKDPINDRDLALISEAASVMEKILFVILEVDKPSKIPYNIINQKIESFDINSCKTKKQWSDAQLIITDQDLNSILKSLNSNINNLEIVSTPYSQCLIWLLGQMKPFAKIDYLSKYEYYKTIGKTANNFLSNHANDINSNTFIRYMMIEVLNSVRDYL